MNEKTYRVIAKDNLEAHPHTWKKGLDYEVVEKKDYFILTSDVGHVNYKYSKLYDVMALFEKEATHE